MGSRKSRKIPGTAGIKYKKLNKYHYWSGEKATYNRFIDVRKIGRKSIAGEHLITYKTVLQLRAGNGFQ